jgi:hypothetical protein
MTAMKIGAVCLANPMVARRTFHLFIQDGHLRIRKQEKKAIDSLLVLTQSQRICIPMNRGTPKVGCTSGIKDFLKIIHHTSAG